MINVADEIEMVEDSVVSELLRKIKGHLSLNVSLKLRGDPLFNQGGARILLIYYFLN